MYLKWKETDYKKKNSTFPNFIKEKSGGKSLGQSQFPGMPPVTNTCQKCTWFPSAKRGDAEPECSSPHFAQSVVCLWVGDNRLHSYYGFVDFCLELSQLFYMQQSQNLRSFVKNCICFVRKNVALMRPSEAPGSTFLSQQFLKYPLHSISL